MEQNRINEIISTAQQISQLLDTNNEKYWKSIFDEIRNNYHETPNKRQWASQYISIMRGGMGSFLYFILKNENQMFYEENEALDMYRKNFITFV